MRRRGWKRGDWLVRDEESGFTEYASKCAYDDYGVLKLKKNRDRFHPQDYVRSKSDPFAVSPISEPVRQYDTTSYNQGDFVGATSIPAPFGPATHIYNPNVLTPSDPGIGAMEVGTTFVVR